MRKARDIMRRHWCITLWRDADGHAIAPDKDGVLILSPYIEAAIDTSRGLRARYMCWSLEDAALESPTATLKKWTN